jgi:cytidylate kinase
MTPSELQRYLDAYGIDFVLDALDLEAWYVVDVLINRNVIDEDDLVELFQIDGEDEDEDGDNHDF